MSNATAFPSDNSVTRLPATGWLRIETIIGSDGSPGLLPISRTTLYKGASQGLYHAPELLPGYRPASGCRVEAIRALIADPGGRETEATLQCHMGLRCRQLLSRNLSVGWLDR